MPKVGPIDSPAHWGWLPHPSTANHDPRGKAIGGLAGDRELAATPRECRGTVADRRQGVTNQFSARAAGGMIGPAANGTIEHVRQTRHVPMAHNPLITPLVFESAPDELLPRTAESETLDYWNSG